MREITPAIDRCAGCGNAFEDSSLAKAQACVPLGDESTLSMWAICHGCGHVLCMYLSEDRRHIENILPLRDHFVRHTTLEQRELLHEEQEKVHKDVLGQWG